MGTRETAVSLARRRLAKAAGPAHQIQDSLIFNWQAKRLPYNFGDDFDR